MIKNYRINNNRGTGKFIRFSVASLTVLGFILTTALLLTSGNIPAVIQRLSQKKLVKRNHCFWAATAAIGGILIAAAANVQAAGTPILCAVPTNPACWYLALGTIIATVVGLIAGGAGGIGAARANGKRDLSEIIGLHVFETNHSTGLNSSYSKYLKFFGIFEITPVHITLEESDYGIHFGVHLTVTIAENFVNIVFDSEPGVPSGVGNGSRLSKRQGFKVDWVSYNYDNANKELCEDIAQDRGLEDGSDFFKSADTYKYCGAATKNDHVGQSENYNELGSENAVHGEWYLNTYGGIDGYCNDNKAGAQCSTVGCQ